MRERIDINPLRAFDSDDEGTRGVMASAPTIVGALEGEDAEHFAEVRALLDSAGIAYAVDPTLVRGLDYYTRTIFSFVCDALGAQSEIGGGGRYDGLIEQLGGPATPAVGWAAGIERILLALDEEEERGRARRLRRDRRRRASGSGRWRWRSSCATPASRPRSTSPGAASRASSNTPTGSAPAASSSSRPTAPPSCATWAPESSAPADPGNLVDEMTGGEA